MKMEAQTKVLQTYRQFCCARLNRTIVPNTNTRPLSMKVYVKVRRLTSYNSFDSVSYTVRKDLFRTIGKKPFQTVSLLAG